MNQARAVETRMDLDLRIGAALTRIQTLKLQKAFPGVLENVISYGKLSVYTVVEPPSIDLCLFLQDRVSFRL